MSEMITARLTTQRTSGAAEILREKQYDCSLSTGPIRTEKSSLLEHLLELLELLVLELLLLELLVLEVLLQGRRPQPFFPFFLETLKSYRLLLQYS